MQQAEPQQGVKVNMLPLRPKRVKPEGIAAKIRLVSNHYPINFIDGKQDIITYSIEFEPAIEADSRQVKDEVMKSAEAAIKEKGLKDYTVRGRNIWSNIRIDQPIIVSTKNRETSYTIRIVKVKETNLSDISGEGQDSKVVNPVTQSINVAIKRALRELGMVELGRLSKFYDPKSIDKNRLPEYRLKVWKGIKTSFQVYDGKPFLQIDFASRVLRDETALDYINQFGKNYNIRDIIEDMKGLSVIASYGNYRIYKIDDIDFKQNPTSTFSLNDGSKMTYMEYYRTRYNISIQNRTQPLIVYRDKRNPDKITYLIPELMKMTGLTDQQRQEFKCMQAVAQFTKLTPDQRMDEIEYMKKRLASALKTRNIEISNQNTLSGYMIYAPEIKLNNKTLQTDQSAFFLIKDVVYKTSHIKDWFLVYQGRGKKDDADADLLVDQIQRSGDRIGIKVEKPYFIVLNNNNAQNWVKEIDTEINKGGEPQMIVTFIGDKDKDRLYGALKKYCFQDRGISHQNVLTKFVRNKNPQSVASKIAQQMSVKLGFPLWSIPKPAQVSDRTMIVGIDIYHKLISGKKSCMGFVAHLDTKGISTFSKPIIMREGQEMYQAIGSVMVEAIQAYFANNGKQYLPETIIVYRDGVGSGQMQALKDTEIKLMKEACQIISKDYTPQFAAIMINKKISDRFFIDTQDLPKGVRAGKNNKEVLVNAPSGTVVCDKVTQKYFDFFLCAQYVTQGTCTPTHFTVLENTTNWSEETFWQLTYYQCFNYQNWSGAVRVPACVQYAHKLSYLIGDTYQGEINPRLSKNLSYL